MSQHDMNLANAGGAAFRADANAALVALAGNSSGATAPATTFSYQWWADTVTGILKQRNAANSAWINVLEIATARPLGSVVQRGALAGCTLSTAGASSTMSVTAGQAADSTNAYLMELAATSKITSAWAVGAGNGGLDTGTIANSTTYHWYVIRRPDTGVVDVIFSTSATSPTLPTNYTQWRRIGSLRTDGSAKWVKFVQDGDRFSLDVPVQDASTGTPGSTAFLVALASLPSGIRVRALVRIGLVDTAGPEIALVSDLSTADAAPSNTAAPGFSVRNAVANVWGYADVECMSSTVAGIRVRVGVGAGTCTVKLVTRGWVDTRGREA